MKISSLSRFAFVALFCATAFGSSTGSNGPVDANIFVNLAKKVVPSVVNISTMTTVKTPFHRGGPDDMFRRFFEDLFRNQNGRGRGGGGEEEEDEAPAQPAPRGGAPRAMSLGTGFLIESGLILTNNHVVAEADEIKVSFTEEEDEKPTDGEVVGRDPELDLALIRVKSKRTMTPLPLGDSAALEVGEYVIAVGNPFGQGHSVTHGIISAKGRKAPDFQLARYLQTDAPINPGNSGGPLVNLRGEVIGINNAIDQRAQGIGFAIPINLVKEVLEQLKSKGVVARGYIGVLVNELTPEVAEKMGLSKDMTAPFVTHVYPGEPADKAGLKPYDVIVEFAGKKVRNGGDLVAAVTAVPVNDSASIKVLRGGEKKEFKIKVAQRPGTHPKAKQSGGPGKGEKKAPRIETGMDLQDISPEIAQELGLSSKATGAVVVNVEYGGAADKAGLARGDVIVEVDRKAVKDSESFFGIVKAKKSYLLRVRRLDAQGREAFSVIVLDLKS